MAIILVVEDEAPLRGMLVDHLLDEGHSPIEANNGMEALELYNLVHPDLIVSDIDMPIMDGYQFLTNLRSKHPEIDDIPFLFLSSKCNIEDQIKGLNFGADEYLCKPISFDMLSIRIKLSLSRQAKIKKKINDALAASKSQPKKAAAPIKADNTSSNDVKPFDDSLLASKRLRLSAMQERRIKFFNEPVNFHSASVLNDTGKKVNISRLFIKKDKYETMLENVHSSEFDENFFLNVIELFFNAVAYCLDHNNYIIERAIIVPSIYEYIEHKSIREKYIKIINHLEKKYAISIISEVVNIPIHLLKCEDLLKPLSLRKHVQIVEITRLEQIEGINLRNLRIGAVSMNYDAAAELGKEEVERLKGLLTEANANLYIKEIPEGRLSDAQLIKADLLSVCV